jgi:hypothetical protein
MLTWQLLKEESTNKNWKNSSKFKHVSNIVFTVHLVYIRNQDQLDAQSCASSLSWFLKFKHVYMKSATLGHVTAVDVGFIHLQPGTSKSYSKASAF